MKLSCTLENLKKATYGTERVIGKQIALPILENILLETDKGMLRMAATNLEIGVFIKIGAKIEKEGKITVPARLLSNFINNLPANGNVEMETVGQLLKLKCGGYDAKLKGMEAQEFPIIPEAKSESLFIFKGMDLKRLIPNLLTSVSVDSTRPELLGINVIFKDKEVHLAATDSFRLSEGIIPIRIVAPENYAAFISKNPSLIVPANTLAEVLRMIEGDESEIAVTIEENQIFFQIGNVKIVSRLINGKYPEYKQIIPQEFATKVFLNRDDLLRSVRISSLFTENKSGEVMFRLDVEKQKAEIKAESQERGENSTELELAGTGPAQAVVFNPRYILDGINTASSPEIAVLVNNEAAPVALRSVVETEGEMRIDERFTYIIMPIKK